ncbi:MAG: ABC transporter ATP-binding protein [Thermodesulfobacteriota bacterium]
MSSVSLRNVHKFFGSVHAVRGIDLEVNEGEFIVLVGPSGCGKSTILRLIAGLEEIDEGTIEIGGRIVNEVPPKDRDIAMVFQNYALYPFLSVFENIAFGLRSRKTPENEIKEKVFRVAKMLNLDGLLNRYPRQLSGGQRQRVAMGRAIVRNPVLFLFDEPLSNLDAQLRDEMRGEIKSFHRQLGRTTIYVTHDQVEAMTLADRIVLLKNGQIEQIGSPIDLYEQPATKFVARFIGSPPINFLDGKLIRNGEKLAVQLRGGILLPLMREYRDAYTPYVNQPVTLGLRPEHVSRAISGRERIGMVSLPGTVLLVQPTGSRTFINFLMAGYSIQGEFETNVLCKPGDTLELLLDMNHAILIDPSSERVI